MADSDLRRRLALTVRRYGRTMSDNDGEPPKGMIDELEQIAEEYAVNHHPRPRRSSGGQQFRPQNSGEAA
jgi:hypothetical protein